MQTRPAGACDRPMGAAELLRDLGDATMGRGVPAMAVVTSWNLAIPSGKLTLYNIIYIAIEAMAIYSWFT